MQRKYRFKFLAECLNFSKSIFRDVHKVQILADVLAGGKLAFKRPSSFNLTPFVKKAIYLSIWMKNLSFLQIIDIFRSETWTTKYWFLSFFSRWYAIWWPPAFVALKDRCISRHTISFGRSCPSDGLQLHYGSYWGVLFGRKILGIWCHVFQLHQLCRHDGNYRTN